MQCTENPALVIALDELLNKAYRHAGGKGRTPVEILRMRSYAAWNHRDQNHSEIADALRKQGQEVVEIMQPLDLLVRRGFIEVKRPGSRAKWTRSQLKFISETRFDVCIATDADKAMEFARNGEGAVTPVQKHRLAGFLVRNGEKFFTPNEIAEVLG